jgi:hypothetical protein
MKELEIENIIKIAVVFEGKNIEMEIFWNREKKGRISEQRAGEQFRGKNGKWGEIHFFVRNDKSYFIMQMQRQT